MKMKKIVAGMAASVLAMSAMAVTAFADTTKYYCWGGESVTWGMDLDGDEEADFPGYGAEGYEDYWVGTLDATEGTATLTIPCAKGDKIEFATCGWEFYTGVQYTVTIGDWKGEVKYVDPSEDGSHALPAKATAIYEVTDDVTEVTAEIYYLDKDEALFEEGKAPGEDQPTLFNAWCSSRVNVVTPGDDGGEDSQPEDSQPEESQPEESQPEESKPEESTAAPTDNNNNNANNHNNTNNTNTNTTPAASTDNKATGAGIALAGLAVAGAALVITKKRG